MFAFHFIFQMSDTLFFKIVFRDFKTEEISRCQLFFPHLLANIDLRPAFLPQIVFDHFTLYSWKTSFLM